MTHLAPPRIGFLGTNASANPSTANNNVITINLDFDNVALHNPNNLTPEAFREWLLAPITARYHATANPIATMRVAYNYLGDHSLKFGNAAVNSLWLDGTDPIHTGSDAMLGAQVALDGWMVDLDPIDSYSTQIFSGHFRVIGRDAAGAPITLIDAAQPTVAYSRWVSYTRYLGAGMFQCVATKEQITFAPSGTSVALDALQTAMNRGAGLTLRYCLYAMQSRKEMQFRDRLIAGERVNNPNVGYVLGSITAWDGAMPYSAPIGRVLHPLRSPYAPAAIADTDAAASRPRVHSHGDMSALWESINAPGAAAEAPLPANAPTPPPAPAASSSPSPTPPPTTTPAPQSATPAPPVAPMLMPAVITSDDDRKVVILDVLSTFPEPSKSMEKADLGPIHLTFRYRDAGGHEQTIDLGTIPYDRQTYEKQAGVVEFSYAAHPEVATHWGDGTFSFTNEQGGVPLHEIGLTSVETDDRCVYINPHETKSITIRAYVQGEPVATPLLLGLELWQDYSIPEVEDDSVSPPGVVMASCGFRRIAPDDPRHMIPASLLVPAGGIARIDIAAVDPGCFKIRFMPPGMLATPADPTFVPDWTLEAFAAFRVLPDDDYSGLTDVQINDWGFMYREVFCYYDMLYPVMSAMIPWSETDATGDPVRVRQFAALIRAFVADERLASPLAMPITRELSAGKRKLIQRWCDLQLRSATPPAQ